MSASSSVVTVIDDPQGIELVSWLVLRSAVRLEDLGMKRRGESATSVACWRLGLPPRTSRAVVLDALDTEVGVRKRLRSLMHSLATQGPAISLAQAAGLAREQARFLSDQEGVSSAEAALWERVAERAEALAKVQP